MYFIKGNQKAQTAIEYIILLAAIMAILVPLLGYVRTQLRPAQTPCPANDKTIGCGIQRFVESMGATPNFRYFTLYLYILI